jgi:hypothetical protein
MSIPFNPMTIPYTCKPIPLNLILIPFAFMIIPLTFVSIPLRLMPIPLTLMLIPLTFMLIPFALMIIPLCLMSIPFNHDMSAQVIVRLFVKQDNLIQANSLKKLFKWAASPHAHPFAVRHMQQTTQAKTLPKFTARASLPIPRPRTVGNSCTFN